MPSLNDISIVLYDPSINPLPGLAAGAVWLDGGPFDVATKLPVAAPRISDLGGGRYAIAPAIGRHVSGFVDFGPACHRVSRIQFYDSDGSSDQAWVAAGLQDPSTWGKLSGAGAGVPGEFGDLVTGESVTPPTFAELGTTGIYIGANVAAPGHRVVGVMAWTGALQPSYKYDATMPSSSGTYSAPASLGAPSIADDGFGIDVSTYVAGDLDPFFRLITGRRAICESLARRFETRRGALPYDQNYGLDLRGWLCDSFDVGLSALSSLAQAIEAEASKDERLSSSSAQVTLDLQTNAMTITLRCTAAAGPFTLVLGVSRINVGILRSSIQ